MVLPRECVYRTSLKWEKGNVWRQWGEGVDMECAPPPEFGGPPNHWTPEHLLLAAIESCTLSAFLAYAEHARIRLLYYRSTSEAKMVLEGKAYRFTDAVVRVEVTVGAGQGKSARVLLEKAHSRCPLTRSVNFPVRLEAEVREGEPQR